MGMSTPAQRDHRQRLAGRIGLGALALSLLQAQAGQAQQPAPAADAVDAAEPVSELVVTGSRIQREILDLPTPVSVVSAQSLLANNGQFDIGRALAQQPAVGFSGSMQQNQQSGAAGTRGEASGGLAVVDLRSLGSNRTLVLINGKRRVAGSTDSAAVDLNSLNINLIERVEIITGGASAIYGSDAMSGVVNVIMRDDFEGLRLTANGSQPARGSEGRTYSASLVAGKNFADKRGNITIAADYTKTREITPAQADMRNNVNMINPASTGIADGIPDRILVSGAESYRFSGYGAVGTRGDTRTLGALYFNDDGTARPAPATRFSDGSLFAAYATPCGTACFRFDDTISLVPDITRYNVNLAAHYDLSDAARLYVAADYNNTSSLGRGQPVQQSALRLNIAQNGFLNSALRQQLLAAGATTLQMDRSFFDVGLRNSQVDRNTLAFTAGIKGRVETSAIDLTYDVYGTHGRTRATFTGFNRIYVPNLLAAVDAVIDPAGGQVRCRVDVPALQPVGYVRPAIVGSAACAPFNVFGSTASSQAARDFVRATTVSTAFVRQTTLGLSVSGDSSKFLTLPGGGAIGVAAGAEYRDEQNGRTTDPLVKAGLTNQAASQDYTGGFDVAELFGEVNVPLLTAMPGANLLAFEGAVRLARYSHAGQASAWKLGAIWEPVEGVRLRATVGRAVRAPNIFEAFRPSEGQTTNINDPCSQNFITQNPNRAANCATLGRPAGFVPASGGLGVPFLVSGNPALNPEVSDSWTAGTVLTPAFLPGFKLAVDWFNIDIKDAISFLTPQLIANNCVDRADGPDPALCALITRDRTAGSSNFFGITGGTSTYVNTASLRTSGLDAQLFHSLALGEGRLSTMVSLTYLHRFRNFAFQARPELFQVREGFLGFPRYKAVASLNYAVGGLELGWQGRYQSSQALSDRSPGISRELISPDETGARFYNDVSLAYRLTLKDERTVQFSAGVTNIFNVRLPPMQTVDAISATGGGFDQFGPVVRAGIEVNF